MSHLNEISGAGQVLTLSVKQDNSTANGNDENIITATVTDVDGHPVANIDIVFEVNGSAFFKDNESQILRATTSDDGHLDISLVNTSEADETNEVTAFLFENQDVKQVVDVHFHKAWAALNISSIYNKNKTLVAGQPTIAWCGAEFSILTDGGSGQVSWSYNDDGTLELHGEGAILTVKILQPFFGEKVLTCVDTVTQETIGYSFNITDLLFLVNTPESYSNFITTKKTSVFPDRAKFKELFTQWGQLSAFSDWPVGGEYWTSEYDSLSAWAANADTGEQRKRGHDELCPLIVHINI